MKFHLVSWALVIISALLDSYAAYVVKARFNTLGKLDLTSFPAFTSYIYTCFSSWIILSAGIAFAMAPVLWFIALNRLELTVAYPVLIGLHLAFAAIFGFFFLEEAMTINKLVGLTLISISFYFYAS